MCSGCEESGICRETRLTAVARGAQFVSGFARRALRGSKARMRRNRETGYTTYSAGGRGASAKGPGIPARGGIAQTGAEAWRRACGRYPDPSHAAAYAPGCARLRRKRNHWRSGDAPKCRQRARATMGSTGSASQAHHHGKRRSARRTTPKAIS
jgi:hypothetical protein